MFRKIEKASEKNKDLSSIVKLPKIGHNKSISQDPEPLYEPEPKKKLPVDEILQKPLNIGSDYLPMEDF